MTTDSGTDAAADSSAGSAAADDERDEARLTAWVAGRVQGVGFRWWTRCRALELGLSGYAENLADGRVAVVAEGPRASGRRLLDLLRSGESPGVVDTVVPLWTVVEGVGPGFEER
ncbi:acylphosphatase [Actinoalloteichus hoggarensis]|uniref:acylphosphatase n=1 Tax=Actinoalloteichus hoggarensis TaxID=1470176 RepID=A0A221W8R4_9PSEU|nr:acylphosphatase [Actinoalloteichus hoggarensis]ASO22298.1 Acylphosphatase [Actinoalloteichus hoggarensis]MBB5923283.1 acylphosphatase [Actinoalloteichus hoggarensis]